MKDQYLTSTVTVCSLDDLKAANQAMAGAKAWGCARLRQAGFKVPDGFVVMTAQGATPTRLDLSEYLQAFPPDALFAVRSSGGAEDGADASFAGIHSTLLNVSAAGVANAVLLCMASGRSALADSYRAAQGIREAPEAIGVLVQQMVPADVAGVAFTVDPSGGRDQVVINASWGLGDAVVGGYTDPDSFSVDRATKAIVQRRVGEKRHRVQVADGVATLRETAAADQQRACLADGQVAALTEVVLQVERALGAPQDIEWCLTGGEFWLVQSRPITTSDARYGSPAWSSSHPDIEWSRATALESLPELPKPQVSAAHCDLMERGVRGIAPELIAPVDELGPVVRLILGRLYLNVSQFKHMAHAVGRPVHPVVTAHGGASNTGDADAPQLTPGAALRLLPRLLRLAGVWPPFQRPAWADLPGTRQRLDHLLSQDPRELADAAVFAEIAVPKDVARALGTGVLDASALLLAVVRSLAPGATAALERLRYAAQAANKTQSSQEGLQLLNLVELARREPVAKAFLTQAQADLGAYRTVLEGTAFLSAFHSFLDLYGLCSVFDKDWSLPRYREDPRPLLEIIRLHVQAPASPRPETIVAYQQHELREAWAAFSAAAGRLRGRVARPLVWWALRAATQFHTRRERGRFSVSQQVGASRPWHLALAERLVARGCLDQVDDYFYLTLDEVQAALADVGRAPICKALVAQRRRDLATWASVPVPTVLKEADIAGLQHPAQSAVSPPMADSLQGVVVSNGSVSAHVVVVRDPSQFAKMQPHAIIVTTATDPSWTPLFTLAGGVIAEVGGTLSHAATLARELGLPAVTNVRGATVELKDGDLVHLDATHGLVHVLSRA